MTKSTKTLIVILLATLLCLSLVACEQPIVYQVTFGSNQPQAVEKDGSITAPDYTVSDPLQSFLGWATAEGKTSASDVLFAKGETISYEKLGEYFDVQITSIHIDDCDYVGVWIVYKEETK